jgi:hypothetical protein
MFGTKFIVAFFGKSLGQVDFILKNATCVFLRTDVITNFFKWQPPLFSSLSDRPSYYLNDE